MDNIKDVNFEEVKEERQIRGAVLYYNTSQVADILGVADSTVRYYSKRFENILNIEVINKQRKYKQSDIDKLKFICELKEEGMSLQQIEQYCSEVSFEEGTGIQIKESNPLSIKALAQTLMEHQQEQIALMEERIISRLENHIAVQSNINKDFMDKIKAEVSLTVDEVVSEKVSEIKDDYTVTNNALSEIKAQLDEIKQISYVSKEEIDKVSYKEGFGRKLYKILFGEN